MLGHACAWKRDAERLSELQARVDIMPLGTHMVPRRVCDRDLRTPPAHLRTRGPPPAGSGALAGHAFGLDRDALARDLGFVNGPSWNSLDAVSDRYVGAMTAVRAHTC